MRTFGVRICLYCFVAKFGLGEQEKANFFPLVGDPHNFDLKPTSIFGLDRYKDILPNKIDWLRIAQQLRSRQLLDHIQNLDLSPRCLRDVWKVVQTVNETIHDMRKLKENLWAMQMVDSFGKPGSGLLLVNTLMTGSYSECVNITTSDFDGQYCMAEFKNFSIPFKWGVCFPSSCDTTDVEKVVDMAVKKLPGASSAYVTVNCQKKKLNIDTKAIVAIIVLGVIGSFVFFATCFDFFTHVKTYIKSQEEGVEEIFASESVNPLTPGRDLSIEEYTPLLGNTNKAKSKQKESQEGKMRQIVLSFSAYRNGCKLLNTAQPPGALPALNGVRFLSMSWVILGHTYNFVINYADNPGLAYSVVSRWTFQPIINGTFSVDSFFVLSGLLVAYGYFREYERKGRINWVYYYIHRYVRLTPVMGICIMFYTCLLRYCGSGPFWRQQGWQDCSENWWANFLYVNNVAYKTMCFPHTWYLANDMQFYWIAPAVLIALSYSVIGGVSVISILVLMHVLTNGLIMNYNHHLEPGTNPSISPSQLYDHPYSRVGPYALGLMFGYLVHKSQGRRLRMPKIAVLLCWCVASVIGLSVIYGLHRTYTGHKLTTTESCIYSALSRPAWGIAIGWLLLACCSKSAGWIGTFLSWRGFTPLARLTYCAYLIHPLIIYIFYTQDDNPQHLTDMHMIWVYCGNMVISYILAFGVSVCFEAPFMQLEKVLVRRH